MNRIDRLSAILIQLQSKRVVTAKEISKRFQISIRTVYRDIRALEAAGIPIGSDAGLGYYLAEGYHLPPVTFTTEEACALMTAGKFMDRFSDDPINEHFSSALYKVKAVLKDEDKEYLDILQNKIEVYPIAENRAKGSHGFFTEIQAALCKKNVVFIEYQSPQRSESTVRAIEPVFLGFYDFHWHLIAYCRLRNEYRDFRMDRIRKLSLTEEMFDEKRHPPIHTLLMKMTENKKLYQATIRFNKNSSYETIRNKCIWGLVEEKDLGTKIEVVLLVDSLHVLGRWLLDYANDAEIVCPDELRLIMKQYISEMAQRYS
jgi:predicted DNA-binding transcriptional regulator YafY